MKDVARAAAERAQRRLDRHMMTPAQRARWLARREAQLARLREWYAQHAAPGARHER